MAELEEVVLQPAAFFELAGVKDPEEAEKVLALGFDFLAYLQVGQEFQTSKVRFLKLAPDLLHMDVLADAEATEDTLRGRRIVRHKVPV